MIEADRVLSTPPLSTPIDTNRRRFLTVAAGASVASVGTLAAAAMPATAPDSAACAADPIYDLIEKHRHAREARSAAVKVEFGDEEETCCTSQMNPEQRAIYDKLADATRDSWDHLDDAAVDLLSTKPTTVAGAIALCEYLAPLFDDPALVDLPESIAWDDDTESTTAGAFVNVIAKALRDIAREVRS